MRKEFVIALILILSVSMVSAFSFGELFSGLFGKMTGKVIVNSNVTFIGNYSGFYDFPESFFKNSSLSKDEIIKLTDLQYLALKDMHNGVSPYDFCRIEYKKEVYGSTLYNGLMVGDAASPSQNRGSLAWDVLAHEQGHNFFGGTSAFYYTLAAPYAFLQESLAVLSASYVEDYILKNSDIDNNSKRDVISVFDEEDDYQEAMYNKYITNGRKFNVSDTLTSQALDWKMIQYGKMYGFENYKKLSKIFEDSNSKKFSFQLDGVSPGEQSTFIVAALGVSFGKDFRQEFANLSFPINNSMYDEIYPILNSIINENISVNFILTCKRFVNYTTSWQGAKCNATDCGKDVYVGCNKKTTILGAKRFREVCQRKEKYQTECSENSSCGSDAVVNKSSC